MELSAVEQDQVNQVLSLPGIKKVADILLANKGLISLISVVDPNDVKLYFTAMRPSRSDLAMQARLMKLAKKGSSSESAGGSELGD